MSVPRSSAAAVAIVAAVSSAGARPLIAVRSSGLSRTEVAAPLTSDPDPATRRDILSARESVWRAWFANDTAQLRRLIPDVLAAGDGGGETDHWSDRSATMEQARRFVASGGRLEKLAFGETEIRLMGEVAVVFSRYAVDVTGGGLPSHMAGRATEVFVRDHGQWVNPFWHLAGTR
jgi:hypothetical protein